MAPTDVSGELAVFTFMVQNAQLNRGVQTPWILKMGAASSSETSMTIYLSKQLNTLGDMTFQQDPCRNHKSRFDNKLHNTHTHTHISL